MKIEKADLLFSDELHDMDFSLELNANRGSYNPMQFVIRLSPEIHKHLNEDEMSYDRLLAFSTFLHENIHWWQHVGSTFGFLTSLSYPALSHMCHKDLNTLISRGEKFKSIVDYDMTLGAGINSHSNGEVNRILNNWHDIHYAKLFTFDPNNIHRILKDKRFFLSLGHCFNILWSSSISTLSTVLDPDFKFLPKVNEWHTGFDRLEKEKIRGFYIDSDVNMAPIGTRAIFEGQARFNQLQYLAVALNNKFSYKDFEEEGLLRGVYIEAFDIFLKVTKIERPDNLNNSVIALFLLVCDIAINPVDGFPIDIYHYESFILCNDPGLRFILICQAVGKDREKWKSAIKEYSRKEYQEFGEELCKSISCFPPHICSVIVNMWATEQPSVQRLLKEEAEMKFEPLNQSIRLFTSKFLRFQLDKLKYPSFFCWPGKMMAQNGEMEIDIKMAEKLFNDHKALFINDPDDEIKPTLFEGKTEQQIVDTFQLFFSYNTLYDMIIKWILSSGDFIYDYEWLSNKFPYKVMKDWIRNNFKSAFGIYPEDLTVLNKR